MTATPTETLPPTRSEPHAGIDWTPDPDRPGCALLVIKQRRYCRYAVTEFASGCDGRAFRLSKPEGESVTDPEADSYYVLSHRGGQDHRCCCKGFEYGRGRPYKHVLAMLAVLVSGWV